jgi:acyl-CoA synthetase (AMP-forming)/AMP-acid ligase II
MRLVGWVVAVDAPTFSMEAVYEHVVRRAAADALPDYLLLVDEIPRRPDGAPDHVQLVWPS